MCPDNYINIYPESHVQSLSKITWNWEVIKKKKKKKFLFLSSRAPVSQSLTGVRINKQTFPNSRLTFYVQTPVNKQSLRVRKASKNHAHHLLSSGLTNFNAAKPRLITARNYI